MRSFYNIQVKSNGNEQCDAKYTVVPPEIFSRCGKWGQQQRGIQGWHTKQKSIIETINPDKSRSV